MVCRPVYNGLQRLFRAWHGDLELLWHLKFANPALESKFRRQQAIMFARPLRISVLVACFGWLAFLYTDFTTPATPYVKWTTIGLRVACGLALLFFALMSHLHIYERYAAAFTRIMFLWIVLTYNILRVVRSQSQMIPLGHLIIMWGFSAVFRTPFLVLLPLNIFIFVLTVGMTPINDWHVTTTWTWAELLSIGLALGASLLLFFFTGYQQEVSERRAFLLEQKLLQKRISKSASLPKVDGDDEYTLTHQFSILLPATEQPRESAGCCGKRFVRVEPSVANLQASAEQESLTGAPPLATRCCVLRFRKPTGEVDQELETSFNERLFARGKRGARINVVGYCLSAAAIGGFQDWLVGADLRPYFLVRYAGVCSVAVLLLAFTFSALFTKRTLRPVLAVALFFVGCLTFLLAWLIPRSQRENTGLQDVYMGVIIRYFMFIGSTRQLMFVPSALLLLALAVAVSGGSFALAWWTGLNYFSYAPYVVACLGAAIRAANLDERDERLLFWLAHCTSNTQATPYKPTVSEDSDDIGRTKDSADEAIGVSAPAPAPAKLAGSVPEIPSIELMEDKPVVVTPALAPGNMSPRARPKPGRVMRHSQSTTRVTAWESKGETTAAGGDLQKSRSMGRVTEQKGRK